MQPLFSCSHCYFVIQNLTDLEPRYLFYLAFRTRVYMWRMTNHSGRHQALSDIPRKIMPFATEEKRRNGQQGGLTSADL